MGTITFKATVKKFPGKGGWVYAVVPQKFTTPLKKQSGRWGMYPVEVTVGQTMWSTKLMRIKDGDYFVALNAQVRNIEGIVVGKKITVTVKI